MFEPLVTSARLKVAATASAAALVCGAATLPACEPSSGAAPVAMTPGLGGANAPPGAVPLGGPSPSPVTGSPPPTVAPSPGCGKPAPHPGVSTQQVTVSGQARSYILVVPDGYAPTTGYPLVMVFHGGGGNAAGARGQTDLEKAASGRAIFVYPESAKGTGNAGGNWDLDSPAGSNPDVALFDSILLSVHNTLCADPRRVFLTGFSNGAYMANQLACRRGERVRGIVTHAGGGPYETKGTYDAEGNLQCAGKAVAALVVHGQSDGTVAPSEGDKSLAHWSHANRCTQATQSALIPPCVLLQGCYQPVGSCRIAGLGHGLWKEAGKVTWSFFSTL